jgi:hypothetical protein
MAEPIRILDELRQSCASVADRAASVRIKHEALPAYAAALDPQPAGPGPGEAPGLGSRGAQAAFWITLDAINFGSGWFPTLSKRPGQSGYFTVAAGVRERFDQHGPWSAGELASLTGRQLAETLGQEPRHQLMELFARSLNDLGRHLADEHGGSFQSLVDSAVGSAQTFVTHLAQWKCFSDTSPYQELRIPFLKRAQITAADLQRAGAGDFEDIDRLTMFADNLVPHVLRLDGVLEFDPELTRRIDAAELIEHDSPEEVEIRACALHAVELIVAARDDLTAARVDQLLWQRGQGAQYKARPRHRSRCTSY